MRRINDWPPAALLAVSMLPAVLFVLLTGYFVWLALWPGSGFVGLAVYGPIVGLGLAGAVIPLLRLLRASWPEVVVGVSIALFCVDMLGVFFAILTTIP